MKHRCLVADDNLIDRDLILRYLSKAGNVEVVASCSDGHEAAQALANNDIDIVFSDIDMPDLSGIGLKRLLKNPPVFVFITSHAEYAVESFALDVVDFVVKPLSFERFFKALNKAIEYSELKKNIRNIGELSIVSERETINLNNGNSVGYFFIKETQGITKLRYSDVLYIESMGDYSKIFTLKGVHVTLVNLKSLEKQLPDSHFLRVQKQYIVGLQHVVTITANEVYLTDKQIIPLSSSCRQQLIDMVVSDKLLSRSGD